MTYTMSVRLKTKQNKAYKKIKTIKVFRKENNMSNTHNINTISVIFSGNGAVFVRWGRNVCPVSSTLVYNGSIT